jgi:hypothetical protein
MADTKTPLTGIKGFGNTVYSDRDMPEMAMDIRHRQLQSQTPVSANPAAMRNYTRYAGEEMQGALSSPDAIRYEIANLYSALQKNPDDVVSQYRLRILSKALQDIFNVNETPYTLEGPTTPGSK